MRTSFLLTATFSSGSLRPVPIRKREVVMACIILFGALTLITFGLSARAFMSDDPTDGEGGAGMIIGFFSAAFLMLTVASLMAYTLK